YLFYLVPPSELQSYQTADEMPQFIELTKAWMLLLVALEMIVHHEGYSFPDTVTSVSAGVCSMMFKFNGLFLSACLYPTVWEAIHMFDLSSIIVSWLVCFLFQDLVYYLGHRAIHGEVKQWLDVETAKKSRQTILLSEIFAQWGAFWGFHQMHHSSEYYNLSTAIRQGAIQDLGMAGFDLLQAVIVPPSMFMPHKTLNILYQFWLHTEMVPRLPIIELVFNTPSAHRVHHGRNPYCIDRNYGGTLIIWDRLFGTFTDERTEEPVVYGLVTPVNSFNQFYLQFFEFYSYICVKPFLKNEDGSDMFPGAWTKFTTMFAPPGAYPGVETKRFFLWHCMVDNEEGIPPVRMTKISQAQDFLSEIKARYISLQVTAMLFFVFTTVLSGDAFMKNASWMETAIVVSF
ncbi:hypothetical protein PFISCL1PPCAC_4137, partial [Pristionchus fissidentatus]